MSKGKILFKISGSIATFKSAALISRLIQSDFEVEVVMTKRALEFVGRATFEGLTGRKVHADTFENGTYMAHIHLDKWADLVILCPATANTINKLACGIADDLVSTLFLAHDFSKPYLLAPAMNTKMYSHPATQQSMKTLRGWGVEVLEANSGALACGDTGAGRLLEPDELFTVIERRLNQQTRTPLPAELPSLARGAKMRILITSGATSEPIDGIRSITNFSSGKTGAKIAEHFVACGHDVTLLHAKNAVRPQFAGQEAAARFTQKDFVTFQDLARGLHELLNPGTFDAVIHTAAVGDYAVASVQRAGTSAPANRDAKLASGLPMTLDLVPNPKLVNGLREMSRHPSLMVTAFKLTQTANPYLRLEAVQRISAEAKPDWIVLNDFSEISFESNHACIVFENAPLREVLRCENKLQLAAGLEQLMSRRFAERSLNRKETS